MVMIVIFRAKDKSQGQCRWKDVLAVCLSAVWWIFAPHRGPNRSERYPPLDDMVPYVILWIT
jgi:hypothetical protein